MWKVWINLNLFKKELNWPGLNRLVNSSLSPASQISKKRKRDGANIYEMSFVILKLFCNYLMPEVTDNMILWFVRLLVSLISCVNVVDNIESGSIPRRLGQVKLGQNDEFCHNVPTTGPGLPDDWAIAHLAHPLEPALESGEKWLCPECTPPAFWTIHDNKTI